MNIDPHNHERAYKKWQKKGMPLVGISAKSAEIIRTYLEDMEIGANVSPASKKGSRSYGRLRNLKTKLLTLTAIFEHELEIGSIKDLEQKERELLLIFKRMREGDIRTRNNLQRPIRAVGTYVKAFKAFWHWYQRQSRRQEIHIKDITQDLDGRDDKPKFNYFTIEDLKLLCDEAKYDYKVIMMFLYDTGIRAPTEMLNVKVNDLEWDAKKGYYILNIREETSKTFGRKIKLLLCSEILKEYIERNKIPKENYVFDKKHYIINQYIKNLAYRILKIGTTREKISKKGKELVVVEGLTMYDFRHCSACYWLLRYKSESALKYRFGWKKSSMIHYYTELLGMKDTIEDEDLYLDISKTELENKITEKGKEIDLLQEQLKNQDNKMSQIMKIIRALELDKMLEEKTRSATSAIHNPTSSCM